jgi:NitT/TauT family transport system substrate-binding protein
MPSTDAAMPGRGAFRPLYVLALVSIVAALAAAGCGSASSGPARAPQTTDLVVAAVPGEGSAGLYVAQDQGLFRRAGLKVTIEAVTSSSTVIPLMVHGQVQVAAGQYTSYVAAQAAGIVTMRILAAGYSLGPGVQDVMVGPRSPVRAPALLRGAVIAVNVVNSETTDLLYNALAAYDISPSQVRVAAIPFPAMPAALAAHRVSAIYEIEPYATEAGQRYGDQDLLDIDTGANQDFPVSGYASLAAWADQHPRAAAAFTRAIEQGNILATTNLTMREHAFETSLHISSQVADVMATGIFPAGINPAVLQRVPDLMLEYGQLTKPLSITALTGR